MVLQLKDLPDDLLADVASRLRVQDIFTWRLASKYFKKRIDNLLGQVAIELMPPEDINGGRLAALCHLFPGAASLNLWNLSHSSLHDDMLLILPTNLERLSLHEYSWVTSEGLSHLARLKGLNHLVVGMDCVNLEELPNVIGGLHLTYLATSVLFANVETLLHLNNLVELELMGNETFSVLPRGIGNSLKSLESLRISDCPLFEVLGNIWDLKSLRELHVVYCPVTVIPDAISELCSLERLCFGNTNIATLPATISALGKLTLLSVVGCAELVSLPRSIGALQSLKSLYLTDCVALQALPVSLDCLSQLTRIAVIGCTQLVELRCHGCTIDLHWGS